MAVTKTLISNSPTRSVIKITGTAAADTSTIYLKSSATPSSVTLTFNAAAKTIVRSAGSWLTDFTNAVVGSTVFITFTGGTVNNVTSFSGVITSTTTITVNRWYTVTDETSIAVSNLQWTGYWSDVAMAGQVIGTPAVNITKIWYSVSSSGDVLISRNSVAIAKLFGHDTIDCFGLAENNSNDVVVLFEVSAGGTAIIELSKIDGFNYPPSWTAVGT